MQMNPRRAGSWLAALLVACATALLAAPAAFASHTQLALFQEPSLNPANATSTLDELERLGVGTLRVTVAWNTIAPATYAKRAPAGFDPTNPASRFYNFAALDPIVRAAAADGIAVDLSVTGPAPVWANGPGKPRGSSHLEWRPNATQFGRFVQAVALRYGGHFTPAGDLMPLPRVSMWEIWNEPNFGPDLAPQATNGSRTPVAAPLYRGLVDAAWTALSRTQHTAHDRVILGNLDARGQAGPPSRSAPEGYPGNFAATKPLVFIRQLYCVDSLLRPLRGSAAAVTGCPTTTAGIHRFRGAHPALFTAGGFGAHPYPFTTSPTQADTTDPDQGEFTQLPNMIRLLDGVARAYGSGHRFDLYNTEYGYITNPPNHSLNHNRHFASPALAATYLNETEYLSYVNPRIATTMQFLLRDPNPLNAPEYGGFASGLEFHSGKHKPSYDAYRLPLWIPSATVPRGRRVLVWGAARPAAALASRAVQIQFRAGNRGAFATLRTVNVTNPRGYFTAPVLPPRSGVIRLAWAQPKHATNSRGYVTTSFTTVYSRYATVTVR